MVRWLTSGPPEPPELTPLVCPLAVLVTEPILTTPPMLTSLTLLVAVTWPTGPVNVLDDDVCALPNPKVPGCAPLWRAAVELTAPVSEWARRSTPGALKVALGCEPVRASARIG